MALVFKDRQHTEPKFLASLTSTPGKALVHCSSISIKKVESSSDLASRMERLQLPSDTIEPDELASAACDNGPNTERANAGDATPTRSGSPVHGAPGDDGVPEADSSVQEIYDVILAATRIYARVEDREVDAISSISTKQVSRMVLPVWPQLLHEYRPFL